MKRTEFIKKILRVFLLAVLGFIAAVLGRRTVSGSNCSACRGKGICNGESDCAVYLSDSK